MKESQAWYEGGPDPLENTVDLGKENNFEEWLPKPPTMSRNITDLDPLQQLILSEDEDINLNDYLKEPPCHS
jgi:hypothetical protein